MFDWEEIRTHCPIQACVSQKTRKLHEPEKSFVKLRPAYSVELVFSYVVKGIKIITTAKFRAPRRLRFQDTKRVMSLEMRTKISGTFEKQAPGIRLVSLRMFTLDKLKSNKLMPSC